MDNSKLVTEALKRVDIIAKLIEEDKFPTLKDYLKVKSKNG